MKTLVLIGGGHAHLHCLEQFAKDSSLNVKVVLISPSPYQYYSGMFSGFAEGVYSLDDVRIDLKRLCENIGVVFIDDFIVKIDPKDRLLTGAQGSVYNYDLVSFDIGSILDRPKEADEQISPIEPNFQFPKKILEIRETTSPVIIGGGASGVELALSIHAWRKKTELPIHLVLLSSSPLLSANGQRTSRHIQTIAARKGLTFFTGQTAIQVDEDEIIVNTGQRHRHSALLWLTGPISSGLFNASSLQTDDHGFLLVSEALQSKESPDIFGAGDCITIERYPSLPKNGVYAVRQGPILWHNLKKRLESAALKSFKPQKQFMAILSTGDGKAFMIYGDHSFHGRIPWLIKKAIDRKFIKQYKRLYE